MWGDKLPGRSPAHSYVQAVMRSEDLNVPLNLKEVSVSGVPETALASGTMRSSLSSGTRRCHTGYTGAPLGPGESPPASEAAYRRRDYSVCSANLPCEGIMDANVFGDLQNTQTDAKVQRCLFHLVRESAPPWRAI